jgi:hypothetical protein
MYLLATLAVLAIAAAVIGARTLLCKAKPRETHMRCSICGGIIPPGWPVSTDGEFVAHRFKTMCLTKGATNQ